MKKSGMLALLVLTAWLLCGCAYLLQRDYTSVEPHTSQSWESGGADVLEAEGSQEVENAVLTMISRYVEDGTVQLKQCYDETTADQWVSQALTQVQKQTGLGAYAVDYMLYSIEKGQNVYEANLHIGYRRTEEQIKNVYYASTMEAIKDLLPQAIQQGREELAVHISSFDVEDVQNLDQMLRELLLPAESQGTETFWQVNYYPSQEEPALIEILF